MQSIATSGSQNDSGLFELNFRDERYLPFEGSGVISQWQIELSGKWRNSQGEVVELTQFDFNTISDIIFHIRYTARDGGNVLKEATISNLQEMMNSMPSVGERTGLFRAFSLRHDFPNEWHRFLYPPDTATSHTMQLTLTPEKFPFQFRNKSIEIINQVELFLKLKDEKIPDSRRGRTYLEEYVEEGNPLSITLTPPGATSDNNALESDSTILGGIPHNMIRIGNIAVPVSFVLEASEDDIGQIAEELRHRVTIEGATHHRLNPDAIEDIFFLCHYSVR